MALLTLELTGHDAFGLLSSPLSDILWVWQNLPEGSDSPESM
jgi:hypothetical protein